GLADGDPIWRCTWCVLARHSIATGVCNRRWGTLAAVIPSVDGFILFARYSPGVRNAPHAYALVVTIDDCRGGDRFVSGRRHLAGPWPTDWTCSYSSIDYQNCAANDDCIAGYRCGLCYCWINSQLSFGNRRRSVHGAYRHPRFLYGFDNTRNNSCDFPAPTQCNTS